MTFTPPKKEWKGKIRKVKIGATPEEGGTRGRTLMVGGESALPFHHFEGEIPLPPALALEVSDRYPEDWAESLRGALPEVIGDPGAWATWAEKEIGVDLIFLKLDSTHPEKGGRSAEEAAETVRAVLRATSLPLAIAAPGASFERDNEVLNICGEAAEGEGALMVMAETENYKSLVATCMAYGHSLVAMTPIDINMAKQLNILLTQMAFPPERIVMDPMTGALGYGLEYTYSVMERIRLRALTGDEMLQMPMLCNVGGESWKVKEAKAAGEEGEAQGVLWEVTTATNLLLSGADILVLRHPKSVAALRKTIEGLMQVEAA